MHSELPGSSAKIYRAAGRLDDAIPMLERTLADAERVLGGAHPLTPLARKNLTSAYQEDGRWN